MAAGGVASPGGGHEGGDRLARHGVFVRIDRDVTAAPIHAERGEPPWDRRRRRGGIDPNENVAPVVSRDR